ncbi:MAG: tRNA (adenosine(37)-N6)-threonylcarbamoyltransferase complex transferase subunit TsaD [Oscillospiraceae bacterium]|nr:tRNA (adenosine(37)-N6)-threonylcarbamoyltransferase complex transferase subunit TsaD [Oscillospiraceae bacterium]
MKILAIESSCDETSCAVVENGSRVLSNVTASQIEEHKLYGGVVPEIASRRHCECIVSVCELALERAKTTLPEIDAVAVSYSPGLIGALLVGVNFAKGIALACGKPLIPVHHIRGHIASNYLDCSETNNQAGSPSQPLNPPFLALVVSGGHTTITHVKSYTEFEVIGTTLDDAAGEAFDKAARAMGLPYPGGLHIDILAQNGDYNKYKLPFPKTENKHDFSFSGLKTAVINLLHNSKQSGQFEKLDIPSVAASFQHTVCEILVKKTMSAAAESGMRTIALSGGVAANSYLRNILEQNCRLSGYRLFVPSLEYCGDNAAMIGAQAYHEFLAGNTADSTLNAYAARSIAF